MSKQISMYEAFMALEDVEDDEPIINEGKNFELRNNDEMEDAKEFRENDKKTENVQLEVIDPDADAMDHLKSAEDYVGQMLLQCNACKATLFINMDKLEQDENDKDMYNLELECPHCHSTGTGYSLLGQVGKVSEEEKAEAENDEKSEDEATIDNDETKEDEDTAKEDEEETSEEGGDTESDTAAEEESEEGKDETEGEPDDTFAWDETPDEDDTKDMEDKTGEEVDDNEVEEDDTEDKDEDEDDKKKKEESLTEDGQEAMSSKEDLKAKLKKSMGIKESLEDGEQDLVTGEELEEVISEYIPIYKEEGLKTIDELADKLEDELSQVNMFCNRAEAEEIISNYTDELEEDFVKEELDLDSWEGSVDSFLSRFTLEDQRLAVNFFNADGNKIASYDNTDDIPFDLTTSYVNEFNTDDNIIEIEVCEPTEDDEDDVCSVNTLFDRFHDNEETTFTVTNTDTDETEDVDNVSDLLEQYGVMNIVGTIGVSSLNFYVEQPEDEELPEGETRTEVESLIRDVLVGNKLKESKINNPKSVEYFINESIKHKEDLDIVYNSYVKELPNSIVENFKSITGFQDETDKLLESAGVSKEDYKKLLEGKLRDKKLNERINSFGCNSINELYEKWEKAYLANDRNQMEIAALLEDYSREHNEFTFDYSKEIKALNSKNESLFRSVRDRKELGEYLNLLNAEKLHYQVRRSTNENYRYDIFLLKQSLVEGYNPEDPDMDVQPLVQPQDITCDTCDPALDPDCCEYDDDEEEFNDDTVEFDNDDFDEVVSDYFGDTYDDPLIYRTTDGSIDDNGVITCQGIVESYDKSMNIKFTLTPKGICEGVNCKEGYTVTNNLSDEKFDYNPKH